MGKVLTTPFGMEAAVAVVLLDLVLILLLQRKVAQVALVKHLLFLVHL